MKLSACVRNLAVALSLAVSSLVAWSSPAEAHRDGCHAQHSCPSDSGSYVCGDTGNFSECGYSSIPEARDEDYDPPHRPDVSKPKTRASGQVAVTVTAERGAKVVVKSGGRTFFKTVASGGAQAFVFKGLEGTHDYSVRATDSSGNTSSFTKFNATADSTLPSLDGIAIARATAENAYTELTITPGETSKYVVAVDGQKTISGKSAGDAEQVAFPVPNGRHSLVFTLTDAAGNVSTFKRALDVQVPKLSPVVTTLTEPNEATQRFSIAGTPSSRGTLTVAGKSLPVLLKSDTAEIAVALPDGTYPVGSLSMRDEEGRTGRIAIPAFVVDTAKPILRVVRRHDDSATGRLVAAIAAEQGARIVWRALDGNGEEVEHGAYVATGRSQTVDVDVDKGSATLEVEASDKYSNVATDSIAANIDADPLSAADWIITLVMLAVVSAASRVGWRRRDKVKSWIAKRQHASHVRKARKAHETALHGHAKRLQQHAALVADHQNQLGKWSTRKEYLTELHEEARATSGSEPTSRELLGVPVKTGERIFATTDGSLIEKRTRQNSPVLVEADRGRVAITNLRLLFQGDSKTREWTFAKLEGLTEVNQNTTLLKVSNRKSLSGVRYDDPERTRLLLALAINPDPANRQQACSAIAAKLRTHIEARPVDPPHPPPAPQPPAILVEADAMVTAAAH